MTLSPLQTAFRAAFQQAQRWYRTTLVAEAPTLEEQLFWNEHTLHPQAAEVSSLIAFAEPPEELTAFPVADSVQFRPHSPLHFFLDGTQHTRLLFVADTIPVAYTVCAVALLERAQPGGRLTPFFQPLALEAAVLIPDVPQARPLWDAFLAAGITPRTTLNPHALARRELTPEAVAASFEMSRYFAYDEARIMRRKLEIATIGR